MFVKRGERMAEPAAPVLIFGPAILIGFIIGVYEALVIHRDVSVPTHRFGHMIHALILSIVFVFITMNTQWFLDLVPAIANIPVLGNVHILRAAIGLIAAIKIHAVSRAIKIGGAGAGLGETWFHSILIGALTAAAPYAYPLLEPILPEWIKF